MQFIAIFPDKNEKSFLGEKKNKKKKIIRNFD